MKQDRPVSMTFSSNSYEQTELIGEKIGHNLASGDCLLLIGELGAGKTTFVRGLARGWGSTIQATSPTFALINRYESPQKTYFLFHIDAYRLSGQADAISTGIEDALTEEDSSVIEWPERITALLPDGCVYIEITTTGPNDRVVSITGPEETVQRLLSDLPRSVWVGWR